jgi:hypothetical protein
MGHPNLLKFNGLTPQRYAISLTSVQFTSRAIVATRLTTMTISYRRIAVLAATLCAAQWFRGDEAKLTVVRYLPLVRIGEGRGRA